MTNTPDPLFSGEWRQTLDANSPQLIVDAGTVWVGSLDGVVQAFELDTGRVRWRCQLPRTAPPPGEVVLSGWEPRMTMHAGVLYAATEPGGLHAIRAKTGQLLWSEDSGEVLSLRPVVGDGRAVVVGARSGKVHGFRTSDGQRLWTHDLLANVSCDVVRSPGAILAPDGSLCVKIEAVRKTARAAVHTSHVAVLEPRTGSRRWHLALDGGTRGFAISGRTVLCPVLAPRDWEAWNADAGLHSLDLTTGERRWHLVVDIAPIPSPVVVGGDAGQCFLATRTDIRALDPATGGQVWSFPSRWQVFMDLLVGELLYASGAAEQLFTWDERLSAGSQRLVALDLATGELDWSTDDLDLVTLLENQRAVYASGWDTTRGPMLQIYDGSSGKLLRSLQTGSFVASGSLCLGSRFVFATRTILGVPGSVTCLDVTRLEP